MKQFVARLVSLSSYFSHHLGAIARSCRALASALLRSLGAGLPRGDLLRVLVHAVVDVPQVLDEVVAAREAADSRPVAALLRARVQRVVALRRVDADDVAR